MDKSIHSTLSTLANVVDEESYLMCRYGRQYEAVCLT